MESSARTQTTAGFAQVLDFLSQDPTNTALLADAAVQAFDAGDPVLASDLIDRYRDLEPLPVYLQNLRGLAAISQRQYAEAVDILASLRSGGNDSPGLRFNLAWAHAMAGTWAKVPELLDEGSLATSPHAPALKIQALHHLGDLDAALRCGQILSDRFPDDQALMGRLACVALDAGRLELAADYAKKAGDDPEGRAALGILALGNQDVAGALPVFETALQKDPANPRALIGKGLSLLAAGHTAQGANALDQGAERFESHLGSWIAAGWAHFILGDLVTARTRFDRALALDPNFSETHGGIAVLNAVEGRWDEADHACQVALRLDKNCFGAVLARSLLLQHRGRADQARRTIDLAMSTVVGPKGQTLGQMVTSLASRLH